MFIFRPASEVDFRVFVQTLNEAYRDYYFPLYMTTGSMRSLIERDSVDLRNSIAAFVGNQMVGISMLAIRPPQAWIGGVGVLPAYRRQGIARQMMDILIDNARQYPSPITTINLEVIIENEAAHRLYLELGFKDIRRVSILEYDPNDGLTCKKHTQYQTLLCDIDQVLKLYDYFHPKPVPWQRQLSAIRYMRRYLEAYCISHINTPERILGYFIAAISERYIQILDIAIDPDCEKSSEVIQSLIYKVHRDWPEASCTMINVAHDDLIWLPMIETGYTELVTQYEMHLNLLPA